MPDQRKNKSTEAVSNAKIKAFETASVFFYSVFELVTLGYEIKAPKRAPCKLWRQAPD